MGPPEWGFVKEAVDDAFRDREVEVVNGECIFVAFRQFSGFNGSHSGIDLGR